MRLRARPGRAAGQGGRRTPCTTLPRGRAQPAARAGLGRAGLGAALDGATGGHRDGRPGTRQDDANPEPNPDPDPEPEPNADPHQARFKTSLCPNLAAHGACYREDVGGQCVFAHGQAELRKPPAEMPGGAPPRPRAGGGNPGAAAGAPPPGAAAAGGGNQGTKHDRGELQHNPARFKTQVRLRARLRVRVQVRLRLRVRVRVRVRARANANANPNPNPDPNPNQLCRHFEEGRCPKGDARVFAH